MTRQRTAPARRRATSSGRRQSARASGARSLERAKRLYEAQRLGAAARALAPLLQQPSPPVAALLLAGAIHLRQGDPEQAHRWVERAVALQPEDPGTRLVQAEILVALERHQEALDLLLAVRERSGDDPQLLSTIGKICRLGGRPEAALKYLQIALDSGADDPDVLLNLGNVLADLGHPDTARRCYEQVLRSDPANAGALLGLATLLRSLGRLEEAARIASRGAEQNPAFGALAYIDAQLTPADDADDPRFSRLEAILARGGLGPQDTSLLHFALAELRRGLGDHDRAMSLYREANRWRSIYLGRSFSLEETLRRFDAYREAFTARFFEERAGWGVRTEQPVFIVGMPRSGTTLIESILGRHPDIHAAGELQVIGNVEHELLGSSRKSDPTGIAAALAADRVGAAARACLAMYDRLAPGRRRIVDKMPHNFERLWLIALLFPGARVIHARRSPLDTCLSCYFTPFTEPHGYRNDLAVLGRYYRAYRELMEHWRRVLPLRFLEVQYEELTADQEEQSRRLLWWCGLPWDERCLDFQSGGVVRTASASQVRRGMYRSSVGRWRPYDRWLGPLREGLGPELVAEAEALAATAGPAAAGAVAGPARCQKARSTPQETIRPGRGSPS